MYLKSPGHYVCMSAILVPIIDVEYLQVRSNHFVCSEKRHFIVDRHVEFQAEIVLLEARLQLLVS